MSKPWVVINAQGRVVTRLEGNASGPTQALPKAYNEAVAAGLMSCQYRPRAKKSAPRAFPYEGTHRL